MFTRKMSAHDMDDYPPKHDTDVNVRLASEDDSDVVQVEGKNYDAKHDQRDMRRLGKRQELKVCITATL